MPHFSEFLVAIPWILSLRNRNLDASPPIYKTYPARPSQEVHPEFWNGLTSNSKACIPTMLFDDVVGSWILHMWYLNKFLVVKDKLQTWILGSHWVVPLSDRKILAFA